MAKKRMIFFIFIIINIFWVIFTERINLEIITIGVVIGAAIIKINSKSIEGLLKNSYFRLSSVIYITQYIILLLKEVIIANFQVAILVLSPEPKIKPRIISFQTKLKEPLLRTILANSITLTPGTLTIEVNEDKYTVHCLTDRYIEGVINSKFEKLLLKLEE